MARDPGHGGLAFLHSSVFHFLSFLLLYTTIYLTISRITFISQFSYSFVIFLSCCPRSPGSPWAFYSRLRPRYDILSQDRPGKLASKPDILSRESGDSPWEGDMKDRQNHDRIRLPEDAFKAPQIENAPEALHASGALQANTTETISVEIDKELRSEIRALSVADKVIQEIRRKKTERNPATYAAPSGTEDRRGCHTRTEDRRACRTRTKDRHAYRAVSGRTKYCRAYRAAPDRTKHRRVCSAEQNGRPPRISGRAGKNEIPPRMPHRAEHENAAHATPSGSEDSRACRGPRQTKRKTAVHIEGCAGQEWDITVPHRAEGIGTYRMSSPHSTAATIDTAKSWTFANNDQKRRKHQKHRERRKDRKRTKRRIYRNSRNTESTRNAVDAGNAGKSLNQ